jgi:hypothetical protein
MRRAANITSKTANIAPESIAQKRGIVKDCLHNGVAFFTPCGFFVMLALIAARHR